MALSTSSIGQPGLLLGAGFAKGDGQICASSKSRLSSSWLEINSGDCTHSLATRSGTLKLRRLAHVLYGQPVEIETAVGGEPRLQPLMQLLVVLAEDAGSPTRLRVLAKLVESHSHHHRRLGRVGVAQATGLQGHRGADGVGQVVSLQLRPRELLERGGELVGAVW